MDIDFGIVDLFAGPGGLAEGFAAVQERDGRHPFRIALSIEKEASAHATLRLRAFLRQFPDFPPEYYEFLNGHRAEPSWREIYPKEWEAAEAETPLLELGTPHASAIIDRKIRAIKSRWRGRTILIGGPPCQAYSLVGRARNRGIVGYEPDKDRRHFLYEEYVRILKQLAPAAFVMENVKGMLSSAAGGGPIFQRVLEDLRNAGGTDCYRLFALTPGSEPSDIFDEPNARDFVVRAEHHGLPQARHRVIVVGLRHSIAAHPEISQFLGLERTDRTATTGDVLSGMPSLRSGLSKVLDSDDAWRQASLEAAEVVLKAADDLPEPIRADLLRIVEGHRDTIAKANIPPRSRSTPTTLPVSCPGDLRTWIEDPLVRRLPNNETRGHRRDDLFRYFFTAAFAEATGRSPRANEFPEDLIPNHRNWKSGKFADRFKVQILSKPSSTITSHISKDGHYYIHPDPAQIRSLTVREAARLQTFPDNYFFKGNRTQQYVQVGNAVPPFLALRIAECLRETLTDRLSDTALPEKGAA